MGRKKYYCEYCDKSFNDDYNTRTKHLASYNHTRLREEHYNNFKDPAEILKAELPKKPCVRYQNDGNCHFGSSCRYRHLTDEEIAVLKARVEEKNWIKPLPVFSEWAAKARNVENNQGPILSFESPYPNVHLPPSLQPFDVLDFVKKDVTSW